MNLFGKKKEAEEEFDEVDERELLEEVRRDKKLTRKFRDLSPENKKKRKEPPKPWGKKERIIVGFFFLFTTISATVMFMVSHGFKFPGLPRISVNFSNIGSNFGEEIIQIGQKEKTTAKEGTSIKAISKFNEDIKPVSGHYGFYLIRLTDGASYGVSTNESFQGASLLKLPLMVAAYKLSEEGKLDLDQKYTLKESDKVSGSGFLYKEKEGSEYAYRDLIKFMGKNSDRTAYKVLKRIVTDGVYKDFLRKELMSNTDINTGNTTPSDLGILLQRVWNGQIISNENKEELLNYLTDTDYEKWITAGIPNNIKVAHKFGRDMGVMGDAAIVQSERPYVIVIIGNGITESEANALFPKISKDMYEIESSN